jgi:hypothetical protein
MFQFEQFDGKCQYWGSNSIVFLDKGKYDYSYTSSTRYNSVNYILSGFSGDVNYPTNSYSVDVDDTSSYPIINSINSTSSNVFNIYKSCDCSFEYLKLNFDLLAATSQRFIYSLFPFLFYFYFYFIFIFFIFFFVLGDSSTSTCKITNCVFSSDITDNQNIYYVYINCGEFTLTNSIFFFFFFFFVIFF